MSRAEGEGDVKKWTEEETVAEKNPKISWPELRRVDSLNLEAGRVSMAACKVCIHYTQHFSSYFI